MHPIRRFAFVSLLTLGAAAGGAGGTFAHAEDEAPASSPAEQAFKDAWWAETGGGNLNEALALYEKAAAAEGPASVKVKARYRRALLLQRIGKTEEAIRALESLATDHPDIAELQAEVRARLEEWTAVDLRTGFPEWYRRFQYGPEFQAKVLDLVLKLGTADENAQRSAENELLTIGEPCVGALRAHLGSRNQKLQQNALKVLLMLGVVPDELASLGMPYSAAQRHECWGTVLDLPAERRAALLQRLRSDAGTEDQSALGAVLAGRDAALEWFAKLAPSPNVASNRRVLWWALRTRIDVPSPLAERVRELVALGLPDPTVWEWFAGWSIEKGLVTRRDVDAWANLPGGMAAQTRVRAARDARLFSPTEGLEVIGQVIASRSTTSGDLWLLEALVAHVPSLPWPESRDEVARLVLALWPRVRNYGQMPEGEVRYREAQARAIELALDDDTIRSLCDAWAKSGALAPGGVEFIDRLLREGPREAHRKAALDVLSHRWPASEQERVLRLLLDSEATAPRLAERWSALIRWPHSKVLIQEVGAVPKLIERLATARGALHSDPGNIESMESSLYAICVAGDGNPFLDLWLQAPAEWASFTENLAQAQNVLNQRLVKLGVLPAVRARYQERWLAGSAADRRGLLWGIALLRDKDGPSREMEPFWRARLLAQPREIPMQYRGYVMTQLSTLTLADLQGMFDLTQPEEADEAADWIGVAPVDPRGPAFTSGPPKVAPSPEVFRALRRVFRSAGPKAGALCQALRSVGEVQGDVAALLLDHEDRGPRSLALSILVERSNPADQELWAKALRDASVSVRIPAAKSMDRVPTPTTIKALVAALDDPHPDVRAAALASLDAIQKMEDLKARWREKVR